MRELNITRTFLAKVIQQVNETHSKHATVIHVAIGEISELDQNSIQAHWSELSKGTSAEHAQLHFRLIPAEVQCMACFQKYHPRDQKISCPYCGSVGAKVLTGEECYLESIETEHGRD
jgi:hydrogenase nickel incorporation protein HypA/HybF